MSIIQCCTVTLIVIVDDTYFPLKFITVRSFFQSTCNSSKLTIAYSSSITEGCFPTSSLEELSCPSLFHAWRRLVFSRLLFLLVLFFVQRCCNSSRKKINVANKSPKPITISAGMAWSIVKGLFGRSCSLTQNAFW